MIVDLFYIIPACCISLSISLACCLLCIIPQKNTNNELPIYTNERAILLENDINPPPYKERENTNIVLIM
jgi:hypothetical protein